MIDINELRRLAQAALIGPDGVSMRWLKLLKDFQEEANPSVICELIDRLEAAEKERDVLRDRLALESQENGALRDSVDRACEERDALRAKIARMEQQEPVAWRTFDGEGGYDYRSYEDNENYKLGWDARNPNHIGWVEPLYPAPAQKEQRNEY